LIVMLLGTLLVWWFTAEWVHFTKAIVLPLGVSLPLMLGLVVSVLQKLLMIYLALSLVDWWYQTWEHEQGIKMSKQELRDEHKEAEGDPHVKQNQKSFMKQMLHDISAKVAGSQVLITNPTHFAVAVQFTRKDSTPKVVASGVDDMALFMRKV